MSTVKTLAVHLFWYALVVALLGVIMMWPTQFLLKELDHSVTLLQAYYLNLLFGIACTYSRVQYG